MSQKSASQMRTTNRSVFSKNKSVRRGAMRSNREEDDAKSHMTRKSGKTHKSTLSKKSRRKTQHNIDEGQNLRSPDKSQKSVRSKRSKGKRVNHTDDEREDGDQDFNSTMNKAKDDKIHQMNKNLDKSVNESFIDSSFNASLSDDDDEDSEDDDYVTFKEFSDFKTLTMNKIKEIAKTCDQAVNKNT